MEGSNASQAASLSGLSEQRGPGPTGEAGQRKSHRPSKHEQAEHLPGIDKGDSNSGNHDIRNMVPDSGMNHPHANFDHQYDKESLDENGRSHTRPAPEERTRSILRSTGSSLSSDNLCAKSNLDNEQQVHQIPEFEEPLQSPLTELSVEIDNKQPKACLKCAKCDKLVAFYNAKLIQLMPSYKAKMERLTAFLNGHSQAESGVPLPKNLKILKDEIQSDPVCQDTKNTIDVFTIDRLKDFIAVILAMGADEIEACVPADKRKLKPTNKPYSLAPSSEWKNKRELFH